MKGLARCLVCKRKVKVAKKCKVMFRRREFKHNGEISLEVKERLSRVESLSLR